MKLETKSVINRRVVVKIAESRGIAIYENEGDWHSFNRLLTLCLLVVSFAYSFMWLEVRK